MQSQFQHFAVETRDGRVPVGVDLVDDELKAVDPVSDVEVFAARSLRRFSFRDPAPESVELAEVFSAAIVSCRFA